MQREKKNAQKNPANNIESASWTFHWSSHMRFHSDTIDAACTIIREATIRDGAKEYKIVQKPQC